MYIHIDVHILAHENKPAVCLGCICELPGSVALHIKLEVLRMTMPDEELIIGARRSVMRTTTLARTPVEIKPTTMHLGSTCILVQLSRRGLAVHWPPFWILGKMMIGSRRWGQIDCGKQWKRWKTISHGEEPLSTRGETFPAVGNHLPRWDFLLA